MFDWIRQGQRELKGKNRSPLIDWINRSYKLPMGSAYCASSISKTLDSAGVIEPKYRGGMARGFKDRKSVSAKDVVQGRASLYHGDVGFYKNGNTVFGHAVIVDSVVSRSVIITLEGNTSSGSKGSQRDGDGFHRRTRTINLLAWPMRFEGFNHVRYPDDVSALQRDPDVVPVALRGTDHLRSDRAPLLSVDRSRLRFVRGLDRGLSARCLAIA